MTRVVNYDNFFEIISHENEKIIKDLSYENYNIVQYLGMSPNFLIKTHIPRLLEELRHYIDELEKQLPLSDETQRALAQMTKIGKTHRVRRIITTAEALGGGDHLRLIDDKYNIKMNELINGILIFFGILRIKKLTRYTIENCQKVINVYRWENEADVGLYEKPRWHYVVDLKRDHVYVRNSGNHVIINNMPIPEFVDRLWQARY